MGYGEPNSPRFYKRSYFGVATFGRKWEGGMDGYWAMENRTVWGVWHVEAAVSVRDVLVER